MSGKIILAMTICFERVNARYKKVFSFTKNIKEEKEDLK